MKSASTMAGIIRARTGDLPGALAALQEAMAQSHAHGYRLMLGITLEVVAVVLARLGEAEPTYPRRAPGIHAQPPGPAECAAKRGTPGGPGGSRPNPLAASSRLGIGTSCRHASLVAAHCGQDKKTAGTHSFVHFLCTLTGFTIVLR
jgi:hypothetical protein